MTLPSELCNIIIRYLHSDYDTPALCNCSLVCRSWVSPARGQLFHSFYIVELRLERTLSILCDKKSTAPPYIRHLHIISIDLNDVLPKLPALNGLQTLTLYIPSWATLSPSACDVSRVLLQNLKVLNLTCKFNDVDEIFELLSSAPSLQVLSLASTVWENDFEDKNIVSRALARVPPPLKRIDFDTGCNADMMARITKWLSLRHPVPHVHTVSLAETTLDKVPVICSFIKELDAL